MSFAESLETQGFNGKPDHPTITAVPNMRLFDAFRIFKNGLALRI